MANPHTHKCTRSRTQPRLARATSACPFRKHKCCKQDRNSASQTKLCICHCFLLAWQTIRHVPHASSRRRTQLWWPRHTPSETEDQINHAYNLDHAQATMLFSATLSTCSLDGWVYSTDRHDKSTRIVYIYTQRPNDRTQGCCRRSNILLCSLSHTHYPTAVPNALHTLLQNTTSRVQTWLSSSLRFFCTRICWGRQVSKRKNVHVNRHAVRRALSCLLRALQLMCVYHENHGTVRPSRPL